MASIKMTDAQKEMHRLKADITLEARERALLNQVQREKLQNLKDRLDKRGDIFNKDNLTSIVRDAATESDIIGGVAAVQFVILLAVYDYKKSIKDQQALNGADLVLKILDLLGAGDLEEAYDAIQGAKESANDTGIVRESYSAWKILFDKVVLRETIVRNKGHG